IQIVPDSRLAQLYPNLPRARVNSIHHQGIKRVAPDFVVEALSEPDGVPEAIRVKPAPGRGYIAATQWHPEFHKLGADTLDDTAILNDFLAACAHAKAHPVRRDQPTGLRDRATRLLRSALRKDRERGE
ncbi:gamma-glutamyl-gamma-aminobutyrate hydrolase family protein, partial [Acidovorax temperans]|uniref:gamma-glutamyl-gamma-aminobutyrate hydrolase family protein n=2 Tax=Comamonadaceae TaxID=80864 RepID=UPI001A93BD1B